MVLVLNQTSDVPKSLKVISSGQFTTELRPSLLGGATASVGLVRERSRHRRVLGCPEEQRGVGRGEMCEGNKGPML